MDAEALSKVLADLITDMTSRECGCEPDPAGMSPDLPQDTDHPAEVEAGPVVKKTVIAVKPLDEEPGDTPADTSWVRDLLKRKR